MFPAPHDLLDFVAAVLLVIWVRDDVRAWLRRRRRKHT